MCKLCFLLMTCLGFTLVNISVYSQKRSESPLSELCTRSSALEIIQQQNATARTFDNAIQRIAVMLRVADLTWPYQRDKARTTFAEAFDQATLHFKEKGNQTVRDGRLPVTLPDQRYTVIGAIAKWDPEWAKKLSEQVVKDSLTETANKESTNAPQLFGVALSLIKSNPDAAVMFARATFKETATFYLPLFLYRLAENNKALADTFYLDALAAYANAPMDRFLYLSSYPFANTREAGEMPGWTIYKVPETVTPNPGLQKAFLQVLLRQAQNLGARSAEARLDTRYSDAAQIWMALSRLENQIQASLPELVPAIQEAKGSMFVLMSQQDQQRAAATLVEPPKKTFAEKIEEADRQADQSRREAGIALAILQATEEEPLDVVVAAAEKLDDKALRAQVLSRLYFNRAQAKIVKSEFEEARKLASKVEQLDQRAYLYSRIVLESIQAAKVDADIREVLEEVLTVTSRAPNTEVKARALLAVAFLFAKVDAIRSIGVLADAIKAINQIENPDFSREQLVTKIEGRQFGSYFSLNTPGFNPENAFREMSRFDFDGLLYQAGQFSNKSLRSMTTLALVEPCLQQTKTEPAQPKSQ